MEYIDEECEEGEEGGKGKTSKNCALDQSVPKRSVSLGKSAKRKNFAKKVYNRKLIPVPKPKRAPMGMDEDVRPKEQYQEHHNVRFL